MKYLLAILISLPAFLSAQSIERQVISGQGASYSNGSIQLDQTVGETVITTESSNNIIITQGFHQPESDLTINVPEIERAVEMKIYPNPTSSQVFVDITKVEAESINIQLIDLSGKLLYLKEGVAPLATKESIDMTPFATGTYILLLRDEKGQTVENFKIELLR
ncbi:MAG: T9SS type A sorting domain-containing protein [Chitinophagales bacterium]